MKKSRFPEEQVLFALKSAEAGKAVSDVCRQMGVSEATFYVWKKRYANLGVLELRELRQLKEENARLWYYASQARDRSAIRSRIRALAASRPRFGYERIHILLRREGWRVSRNRVYRLYKQEGLQVRMRGRRRRRISLHRGPTPQATRAGQYWAMDFLHDQLADGRTIRILTVIDKWTGECIALDVAYRQSGENVVKVLEAVALVRTLPRAITLDNGSEFTSKARDEWCFERAVQLDFIRPGKPTENGTIESFNGRLRDECLNVNEFASLAHAQATLKESDEDYHQRRAHGSLGFLTPSEFANPR
ncbi:MAG: IS3 family transposase [Burkholderiales bacterium]